VSFEHLAFNPSLVYPFVLSNPNIFIFPLINVAGRQG
jgi:hypothetical protein